MNYNLNQIYLTNDSKYVFKVTTCYFLSEDKTAHILKVYKDGDQDYSFFNCVPEFDHGLVRKWASQVQKDVVTWIAEQLKSPIWNKSERKGSLFAKWLIENGFNDMVTK